MSVERHGVVEDIGGLIGYTATAALVDWFGGGNLWIPKDFDPEHAITKVVGEIAAKRLVAEWGGRHLWVPLGYQREMDRRDRLIAALFACGLGSKQIGSITSMSESHVTQVRQRVERLGLLPLILHKAKIAGLIAGKQPPSEITVLETPVEKDVKKPPVKMAAKKTVQNPPLKTAAKAKLKKRGRR